MASLTTHAPSTNHHTIQATSQQDFATSGTSQDGSFDYVVVCDTHGKTRITSKYDLKLKELFENLDWKTVLQEEDFFEIIQNKIKNIDTHKIGSTISICKIYPDRFENYWIGDSSIKIYSEGVEVWRTKDHDYNNEEGISRIQQLDTFLKMKDSVDAVAETKTNIKQVHAKTFYYIEKGDHDGTPESINMTHCLGHKQLTGDFIEHETFPRNTDQKYKVVIGSDGFWQVVCDEDIDTISSSENNSETLCKFSDSRWKQGWHFITLTQGNYDNMKFPDYNVDDIAVACWNN